MNSHVSVLIEKIEKRKTGICIVGLGYVGLPTALYFFEAGFPVIGMDKNVAVVKKLNSGTSHLKELGLEKRLKDATAKGFFSTSNMKEAMANSSIIIITVPTPVKKNKEPDLSYVESAATEISKYLRKGQLVILESTVYPGVTEEIVMPILEKTGLKTDIDFGLGFCPERYNLGDKIHTLPSVARIVSGIGEWGKAAEVLYKTIIKEKVLLVKNIKTAEAAKVIENIQRDLNIALMNELAMIFERLGIDIMDVIEAASTKWNFNVYRPGAGVGGHCIPVDPYYLVQKAKELGYDAKVILAGREVNDYMPFHVFSLIKNALQKKAINLKNSKIVVLGYSYKENVGDLRETPVEKLVEELQKNKANLIVVEPFAENELNNMKIKTSKNVYEASEGADALVLMTAHDIFKEIDFSKLKMRTKIFVDGRRIFSPQKIESYGFEYCGVGYGKN